MNKHGNIVLAVVLLSLSFAATAGGGNDWKVVIAGDSYSAGEANPPYTSGACHRSASAWSNFLFRDRGGISTVNVACSGARIADLFRRFKGQPAQVNVIKQSRPKYVAVTIGGNDVGFGKMLLQCFLWECLSNSQYQSAGKDILALEPVLASAYRALKRAIPKAELYVVGYPRIFPAGKAIHCGWLSQREKNRLNELTSILDTVIRNAAEEARATFVPTVDVLKGHELCTADSWMFPIGNLPHKDYDGHPTKHGQVAIADQVTSYMIHD